MTAGRRPSVPPTTVFFDTWAWVALAHRGDGHHLPVRRWYEAFVEREGIVATSEVVLAETLQLLEACTHARSVLAFAGTIDAAISRADIALLIVEQDVLSVSLALYRRLNGASERRGRRRDRLVSLVDCTSMTLMRAAGIVEVLTGDRHFVDAGVGLRLVKPT